MWLVCVCSCLVSNLYSIHERSYNQPKDFQTMTRYQLGVCIAGLRPQFSPVESLV